MGGSEEKTWPPKTGLRRILGLVAAALVFAGVIPLLIRIFLGFPFLPSASWVNESRSFCWVFGLTFGVIGALVSLPRVKFQDNGLGDIKYVLYLFFVPLFFWWIVSDLIFAGYPMARTIWAGKVVELSYVVKKAEGFSDRKCPNKIELEEMPG